ncbi:MAG: hypothetical protein WC891_02715 [Actinomycetota bacterium]
MTKKDKLMAATIIMFLLLGASALAHQPIIESPADEEATEEFGMAIKIDDATIDSQAVYGAITVPGQTDIYYFKVGKDAVIPVEALVPVRHSNERFAPAVIVVGKNIIGHAKKSPVPLPKSMGSKLISPPTTRNAIFEPFSGELLYSGNPVKINAKKGNTYYFIVYDPKDYTGDYSLAIGDRESFPAASIPSVLSRTFLIKMRLVGGWSIPWLDLLALFAMIGGIVCALGSVMVVSLEAWRGRKSEEWANAAMMTIKATASVMWLGFLIATLGALVLYRDSAFTGVGFLQFIIAIIIAINSAYMWFVIRPRMDTHGARPFRLPLAVSLIISYVSWWMETFLLVWYLLVTR